MELQGRPLTICSSESSYSAQAYNLLSVTEIRITGTPSLLRPLFETFTTKDREISPETCKFILEEIIDPQCFLCMSDSLTSGRGMQESIHATNNHLLYRHSVILKQFQSIRTRNWVKRLKTPLATRQDEATLATAKLFTLFDIMLRTDFRNSPNIVPKYSNFLWSLIDEYRLSYFLVVSSFLDFLENTLEQIDAKELFTVDCASVLDFINNFKRHVPNLGEILFEVIEERMISYASTSPKSEESSQFTRLFHATKGKLNLNTETSSVAEKTLQFYFLPRIPFIFLKAIALLVRSEVLQLSSIIGLLQWESYVRESKHLVYSCFEGDYIPIWFYHGVFLHDFRYSLAKRRKTCIELEGSAVGSFRLAQEGEVEDYLLYFGLNCKSDLSKKENSSGTMNFIPQFLIKNPFIELLGAFFEIANDLKQRTDKIAFTLLYWLEDTLNFAAQRIENLRNISINLHEYAGGIKIREMIQQSNSYVRDTPREQFATFSAVDYQGTMNQGSLAKGLCKLLLRNLRLPGWHLNMKNILGLLQRLQHRVSLCPELMATLLQNKVLCMNKFIMNLCIKPAHAIRLVHPEISRLCRLTDQYKSLQIVQYELDFSLSEDESVEFYSSELLAFTGSVTLVACDLDPMLHAIKQTNLELVHYELIRLVPKSLEKARKIISELWFTAPEFLIEIFIDQSKKKSDLCFIELQSNLSVISEDKSLNEADPWSYLFSIYISRILYVSSLCHQAARKVENGVCSIQVQINEISSIASFYLLSCRAMIQDFIRRSENASYGSARDFTHARLICISFIKEVYDIVFLNILADRAHRLTVLYFLKSFAEFFLFRPCMSESGWCSPDGNVGDFSNLFDHIGSIWFSNEAFSCYSQIHQRSLVDLSSTFMEQNSSQRFIVGQIMQWFSKFGNGYSNFFSHQAEKLNFKSNLEYTMLTIVIFLEKSAGLRLISGVVATPQTFYSDAIDRALWGIESTFTDSTQEETLGSFCSKEVALSTLHRLIDVCNDLKNIFRSCAPSNTKKIFKQRRSSLYCSKISYRSRAYSSLIDIMQKSKHGLSVCPSTDAFINFIREPITHDAFIRFFESSVKSFEKQHRLLAFNEMRSKTYRNHISMPTVSQNLRAITQSVESAILAATAICQASTYEPGNGIFPSKGNFSNVSVTHYLINEVLYYIFPMIPSLTASECVAIGVFLNVLLTYFHCHKDPINNSVFENIIKSLENGILPFLEQSPTNTCSSHNAWCEKTLFIAPLYLRQNCLSILWELRSHLCWMRSLYSEVRCTENEGSFCEAFESPPAQGARFLPILEDLLRLSMDDDAMAIIQPQVIALLKWMKSSSSKHFSHSWYQR